MKRDSSSVGLFRRSRRSAHRLADAPKTKIEAARLLAYRAANLVDAGAARTEAAMAKLAATIAFQEVADLGMQLFGGYDHEGVPIERHWREARVTTVTAGT